MAQDPKRMEDWSLGSPGAKQSNNRLAVFVSDDFGDEPFAFDEVRVERVHGDGAIMIYPATGPYCGDRMLFAMERFGALIGEGIEIDDEASNFPSNPWEKRGGGGGPKENVAFAVLLAPEDRVVSKPVSDGRRWVFWNQYGHGKKRVMTHKQFADFVQSGEDALALGEPEGDEEEVDTLDFAIAALTFHLNDGRTVKLDVGDPDFRRLLMSEEDSL